MTRENATSEAAEQGSANERARVLGIDAIARARSTVSASQFNLNSAREPLPGSLSVPLVPLKLGLRYTDVPVCVS